MQTIGSLGEFLDRQSSPQALHNAQLAVDEIGTNIIKYGYDDLREHRITVRVDCLAAVLRLRILDDGHPFDVRQVAEPDPNQSLDERKAGGWGISLVRQLARRVDYERRDGLNVVTIEIPRD